MESLIAARAIAGIGGGGLTSVGSIILSDLGESISHLSDYNLQLTKQHSLRSSSVGLDFVEKVNYSYATYADYNSIQQTPRIVSRPSKLLFRIRSWLGRTTRRMDRRHVGMVSELTAI
jgi:hypothetical protein